MFGELGGVIGPEFLAERFEGIDGGLLCSFYCLVDWGTRGGIFCDGSDIDAAVKVFGVEPFGEHVEEGV